MYQCLHRDTLLLCFPSCKLPPTAAGKGGGSQGAALEPSQGAAAPCIPAYHMKCVGTLLTTH